MGKLVFGARASVQNSSCLKLSSFHPGLVAFRRSQLGLWSCCCPFLGRALTLTVADDIPKSRCKGIWPEVNSTKYRCRLLPQLKRIPYHFQREVEQNSDTRERQRTRRPPGMNLIYLHFKMNWIGLISWSTVKISYILIHRQKGIESHHFKVQTENIIQCIFPRLKNESIESKRDNPQFNFITFKACTIQPKMYSL